MSLATLGLFVGVTLANLALYAGHHHRHRAAPEMESPPPLSTPTRMFRWGRVVIVLGVLVHLPLETLVFRPQGPGAAAFTAGGVVALVGLTLVAWSLRTLGRDFHPCYEGRAPETRVRTGPYRLIDHPLYVGNLLCMAGVLVATFNAFSAALAALLAAFYLVAIRDENRMLAGRA